ncbi:two-component system response regulator [Leptolyngbya sp. 'hensonii']|uniref:response regulator n=1 Tax=Leptolyngbya sp. 'hensonii' TaxID=1922337 RepID=UPI00094F76FB|nr:response regulator [Leptolyngbya sp. 'hensonii']OLP17740.1 two-component system response regulator [Leptolyngbya sp. 'hensonii']
MSISSIRKRILIIDDEDDIREVTEACLRTLGQMDVLAAASSQEGLKMAEREQPDAILLDVMLPDMDGTVVFKHLQANPRTCAIPVILLTAKVQASDRQRFHELGMQFFIAKPFDPMTLVEQIKIALGWD